MVIISDRECFAQFPNQAQLFKKNGALGGFLPLLTEAVTFLVAAGRQKIRQAGAFIWAR